MRSAVVHDWLVSLVGGSEKALEAICRLFPSPLYTLVFDPKKLEGSFFANVEIHTSFIQKFPKSKTNYRKYFPLFPMAVEDFDFSRYDLIISSSHCVAKGALVHPEQLHICYCYTPVRYAWDLMHEYLRESGLEKGIKATLAKWALHYLRGWDVHSSHRVDHFIAISQYVALRIKKYYGREAEVIYPPVDCNFFAFSEKKESFYVTASRFVPYKKMGLIVDAFSKMPHQKLVVIGDGPQFEQVKRKGGANIEFLGYQPDDVLRSYLQRAKGFVFAALEDFGILPIEAMASGTPVIAFGKGAIKETVIEGKTGIFFHEQTEEAVREAIFEFEKSSFSPLSCRAQAEKFSQENFNRQFKEFVLEKYAAFSAGKKR